MTFLIPDIILCLFILCISGDELSIPGKANIITKHVRVIAKSPWRKDMKWNEISALKLGGKPQIWIWRKATQKMATESQISFIVRWAGIEQRTRELKSEERLNLPTWLHVSCLFPNTSSEIEVYMVWCYYDELSFALWGTLWRQQHFAISTERARATMHFKQVILSLIELSFRAQFF